MKYTVIHSEDPYLLARMATDLQMSGWASEGKWNDYAHPFTDYLPCYDLDIRTGYDFCFFTSDNRVVGEKVATLTSRNYLSILKKVLA